MSSTSVRVEKVMIPTYGVGKPDKNPMFLEKRVYQGSSGKVYPLPVIEKIMDEKEDKPYTAVWLENEYIRVMVLPELGGRIQRAIDKTNGYDFVYYNEVIKPALVGLAGPWISGGIEFNWPQHHRPTTFAPLDFRTAEGADGSVSVEMSEVDQMYGTKGKITVTLYPGRAYIEIRGQLYNRTPLPQSFLWWANPAVKVNDDTQSVFPPDVDAVYDHGKRDVSTFPVATGDVIMSRIFHPWEGGEGKVTGQYAQALKQMAVLALREGDAGGAKEMLLRALTFPHNLGEGKLEGAKDNDLRYYLGLAERVLGNEGEARKWLEGAAEGNEEPSSAMYYNDQPADMIFYQGLANRALGREERAAARFHKLISYGEKHYYDRVKIDYFAVSLPDLQLFDDDLSLRSRAHCEYLIALGSYGLRDRERAAKCFEAALDIDPCHQGALMHLRLL